MNLPAFDSGAFWARAPQRATPWRNPAQAYGDFLAAVAKRDLDAVLARMTDSYARRGFERDFATWCENYPRDLRVTGCRIDGDRATLETAGRGSAGKVAGRVGMVLNGGMWCVGAECWADDGEHPRIARLSTCLG